MMNNSVQLTAPSLSDNTTWVKTHIGVQSSRRYRLVITGKALDLLHCNARRTTLKYIHRWHPVNAHPSLRLPIESTKCPFCCQQPETIKHFLSWNHQLAAASRQQMASTVRQSLQLSHTNSNLTSLVLNGITDGCTDIALLAPPDLPSTYTALFQQQSKIGWSNFLCGQWSISWVQLYYATPTHPHTHTHTTLNGEQWCISTLCHIWTALYSMWKTLCNQVHGTTITQQRDNILRTMIPWVRQLYSNRHQLLHIDQTFLLNRPQSAILTLPNWELENWVFKAERLFKISLSRAKEAAKRQQ
jgi:hypothetical protein